MAKGLFEKAGRIQLPPAKSSGSLDERGATVSSLPQKPKTAPGTLMGFMASQSEAIRENEILRGQAARFEGALVTRQLDPKKVGPSRWANRHESSFESAEFMELKAEIAQAGGNVQPIKVRPINDTSLGPTDAGQGGVGPSNPLSSIEFEIVFGHRRHRACLELGLPILSLIEAASEQELFVQMERENRNRADLSAWEQGIMYARALDGGLYPSNRQLANSIGRDLGDVGRALALARLPQVVIEAFKSPMDLQFRWAKPLNDVQQSDPDGLVARAKALNGRDLTPREVFAGLVSTPPVEGVGQSNPLDLVELKRDGKVAATVKMSASGRVTVKFNSSMDEDHRKKLIQMLDKFL